MLFLGIIRSFAASGVDYSCITYDWPGAGPWWSSHSNAFRNQIEIANPFDDAPAAVDALGSALAGADTPPLLLPSSDTSLMFMLDHEERLGPLARLVGSPAFDDYRPDVTDKGRCNAILESAGVAIPISAAVTRVEDIEPAMAKVPVPAVVKPAVKDYGQSFYRRHGGLKAINCETADDLRAALVDGVEQGFPLVAQEKIDFESAADEIPAYIYVDADQTPWAYVGAVKERIDPPPFGTATVLRLVDQPELFEPALAVAKALRWRGMLMVEFIKDRKDDVWKVIEVNGRPWLMIDYFRRSGVDFIGSLVRDMAGEPAPSEPVRLSPDVDPLHVDLATVIDADHDNGIEPSLAGIEALMHQHPVSAGDLSMPFYAPFDPEPGRRRLTAAAERWNLPPDELFRIVDAAIGNR